MINIGIVDFGFGNLKSIIQIIKKININSNVYLINENFKNFKKIDKLIIPGQGFNYKWVFNFFKNNFHKFINLIINKTTLGICVGKQIFFNKSDEFNSESLSLFNGNIKKFINNNFKNKIPNIGWKKVFFINNHFLLNNLNSSNNFYFSHSYYLIPFESKHTFGLTKSRICFSSIYIKNNIFLLQFHPEKSFKQGFLIFNNFFNWKIS